MMVLNIIRTTALADWLQRANAKFAARQELESGWRGIEGKNPPVSLTVKLGAHERVFGEIMVFHGDRILWCKK